MSSHATGCLQEGCLREHGTASHYRHGCRCVRCKDAHNARMKAIMKNRRENWHPLGVCTKECTIKNHGTWNHYTSGCRCDSCVDTAKKINNDRYTKKKPDNAKIPVL